MMSDIQKNNSGNQNESLEDAAKKQVNPKKKGLDTGHKINLAHAIIAGLGLLLAIFIAINPGIFKSKKTNPCTVLKQREGAVAQQIEDLVKKRANCLDSDSVEKYYDFEIGFTTAELQKIKDSLKLCIK